MESLASVIVSVLYFYIQKFRWCAKHLETCNFVLHSSPHRKPVHATDDIDHQRRLPSELEWPDVWAGWEEPGRPFSRQRYTVLYSKAKCSAQQRRLIWNLTDIVGPPCNFHSCHTLEFGHVMRWHVKQKRVSSKRGQKKRWRLIHLYINMATERQCSFKE